MKVDEFGTPIKISEEQRQISSLSRKLYDRKFAVRTRIEIINQAGNKCVECGYSQNPLILQFHHLNPEQKKDKMARIIQNGNKQEIEDEVKKCIILCPNCHAIIHSGLAQFHKKGLSSKQIIDISCKEIIEDFKKKYPNNTIIQSMGVDENGNS